MHRLELCRLVQRPWTLQTTRRSAAVASAAPPASSTATIVTANTTFQDLARIVNDRRQTVEAALERATLNDAIRLASSLTKAIQQTVPEQTREWINMRKTFEGMDLAPAQGRGSDSGDGEGLTELKKVTLFTTVLALQRGFDAMVKVRDRQRSETKIDTEAMWRCAIELCSLCPSAARDMNGREWGVVMTFLCALHTETKPACDAALTTHLCHILRAAAHSVDTSSPASHKELATFLAPMEWIVASGVQDMDAFLNAFHVLVKVSRDMSAVAAPAYIGMISNSLARIVSIGMPACDTLTKAAWVTANARFTQLKLDLLQSLVQRPTAQWSKVPKKDYPSVFLSIERGLASVKGLDPSDQRVREIISHLESIFRVWASTIRADATAASDDLNDVEKAFDTCSRHLLAGTLDAATAMEYLEKEVVTLDEVRAALLVPWVATLQSAGGVTTLLSSMSMSETDRGLSVILGEVNKTTAVLVDLFERQAAVSAPIVEQVPPIGAKLFRAAAWVHETQRLSVVATVAKSSSHEGVDLTALLAHVERHYAHLHRRGIYLLKISDAARCDSDTLACQQALVGACKIRSRFATLGALDDALVTDLARLFIAVTPRTDAGKIVAAIYGIVGFLTHENALPVLTDDHGQLAAPFCAVLEELFAKLSAAEATESGPVPAWLQDEATSSRLVTCLTRFRHGRDRLGNPSPALWKNMCDAVRALKKHSEPGNPQSSLRVMWATVIAVAPPGADPHAIADVMRELVEVVKCPTPSTFRDFVNDLSNLGSSYDAAASFYDDLPPELEVAFTSAFAEAQSRFELFDVPAPDELRRIRRNLVRGLTRLGQVAAKQPHFAAASSVSSVARITKVVAVLNQPACHLHINERMNTIRAAEQIATAAHAGRANEAETAATAEVLVEVAKLKLDVALAVNEKAMDRHESSSPQQQASPAAADESPSIDSIRKLASTVSHSFTGGVFSAQTWIRLLRAVAAFLSTKPQSDTEPALVIPTSLLASVLCHVKVDAVSPLLLEQDTATLNTIFRRVTQHLAGVEASQLMWVPVGAKNFELYDLAADYAKAFLRLNVPNSVKVKSVPRVISLVCSAADADAPVDDGTSLTAAAAASPSSTSAAEREGTWALPEGWTPLLTPAEVAVGLEESTTSPTVTAVAPRAPNVDWPFLLHFAEGVRAIYAEELGGVKPFADLGTVAELQRLHELMTTMAPPGSSEWKGFNHAPGLSIAAVIPLARERVTGATKANALGLLSVISRVLARFDVVTLEQLTECAALMAKCLATVVGSSDVAEASLSDSLRSICTAVHDVGRTASQIDARQRRNLQFAITALVARIQQIPDTAESSVIQDVLRTYALPTMLDPSNISRRGRQADTDIRLLPLMDNAKTYKTNVGASLGAVRCLAHAASEKDVQQLIAIIALNSLLLQNDFTRPRTLHDAMTIFYLVDVALSWAVEGTSPEARSCRRMIAQASRAPTVGVVAANITSTWQVGRARRCAETFSAIQQLMRRRDSTEASTPFGIAPALRTLVDCAHVALRDGTGRPLTDPDSTFVLSALHTLQTSMSDRTDAGSALVEALADMLVFAEQALESTFRAATATQRAAVRALVLTRPCLAAVVSASTTARVKATD